MGLKRFDYKLKDNSKKKSIIVASIIVLVLLIGVTIYATYAAYKDTKTYNIIQGKVGEFINGDIKINVVAIDPEGKETSIKEFPSYLEYNFLAEQSSCTNGSTIEFDEIKWSAIISSSGKDTCTLKFEQRSDKTLANAIKANTTLVETTPDFSVAATDENTNIYQAEDDLGTSYYFRGASTNNYVKFGTYAEDITINPSSIYLCDYWEPEPINVSSGASMYWRIVRINGDGSIRLIYDGTELTTNAEEHYAGIGSTVYNSLSVDSTYLGYTYDNNGIQVNSDIKTFVDTWYNKNLYLNYNKFMADSIFCNDKSGQRKETIGRTEYIFYSPYDRIWENKNPVLTCSNKYDRYTVNDIDNGNGYLNYPIGLLTSDEAIMAGGEIYDSAIMNYGNYLDSCGTNWTLSAAFSEPNYQSFWVTEYDSFMNVSFELNARPVINLDANIKMYGSGTMDDPYRLTKEL